MSEHYHDAADLRLFKEMSKLAPKEFEAWLDPRRDGAEILRSEMIATLPA